MANEDGFNDLLHWDKLSEETELLSDQMATFFRSNPIAYAGHRILANFVQVTDYDGSITEQSEVPFLDRWFFPIALSGYWLFRRLLNLVGLSTTPTAFDGHILVMHSDRDDKRYTLTTVGEQLMNQGNDVLLLCSPEVESYRNKWEEKGYSTLSFIELLGGISLRGWMSAIRATIRSIRGLRMHAPDSFGISKKTMIVNMIFLEAVKSQALRQATDQPTIHTYAPMGYVLAVTDFDHVFSYQHDIMYDLETGYQEYRRGYPFFAPINYLTWGKQWHDKFRHSTPSDAQLFPTGSPWHEYLYNYEIDQMAEYDVLFLSAAGRQTTEGEEVFEEYVRQLIDVCERRDWRLGIKLHPKESGEWYADRDWSAYVLEGNPTIQDALSNTNVAITTGSSTLVEALLVGTPICKWFDQQSPLERERDLDLVFDITPETIESTLEDAIQIAPDSSDAPSVLNCDEATDRIVGIVTNSDESKYDR